METIGHISFNEIFYCNVRAEPNWFEELPSCDWIAFTIATKEDNELVSDVTTKCLNKKVSCVCTAGEYASETEDAFLGELVLRNIEKEKNFESIDEEETSPMLTFHRNFSEGFWFATTVANLSITEQSPNVNKVLCIDMTTAGVKKHLRDLLGRFNSGELPSDDEFEDPIFDTEFTN